VPDLPTPQDDQDRRLLADVAEHGWHVVLVPELGSTPGWAFSVGLHHTFDHPEIVLFGLPTSTLHEIINGLGEAIRAGGSFLPGTESAEILDGHMCALQPVERCWYEPFLGYATWFYRGADFPSVQCLWPDRAGVLPHDPAFEPDLIHLQPLLWHADPAAARTEDLLHSLDT
jgi:hypothetical protein